MKEEETILLGYLTIPSWLLHTQSQTTKNSVSLGNAHSKVKIEPSKKPAPKSVKPVEEQGLVGIIGGNADSKTPDTTIKYVARFAGNHVIKKQTNQPKKNSLKSTRRLKRLSREDVLLIKALHRGGKKCAEIADLMEVSGNTVRFIILGINHHKVK